MWHIAACGKLPQANKGAEIEAIQRERTAFHDGPRFIPKVIISPDIYGYNSRVNWVYDAMAVQPIWRQNLGVAIQGSTVIDAYLINDSWSFLSTGILDLGDGAWDGVSCSSPDGSVATARRTRRPWPTSGRYTDGWCSAGGRIRACAREGECKPYPDFPGIERRNGIAEYGRCGRDAGRHDQSVGQRFDTGVGSVWASVPYGNANSEITNGHLRAYDLENFVHRGDGSSRIQKLWGSQDWALAYVFNKFLPPIPANGRVYLANYSGGVDVYGP